ncbi:conserved hypothetical protein [Shewanella sp. MR-4]|uniref:Uncharacterized protein n=1 Tax=Shewanella sp. (strain MR-7) TaxID=60481 RepID=Q0HZA3_SHESR|nr:hypothetical protein [Shewanella sp. MR-4]ABI40469.1 conserved hypothetical protein [Shewanella sp. MR-4]
MHLTKLKLMSGLLSVVTCSLITYSAVAGPLDPNCDPEKVAKNAAVKATTGVSGRCTPEKAAERKAEDAKDAVGDAKDKVTDKVDDIKPDDKLSDKASDALKQDKHEHDKHDKKEGVDAKKVVKKVVN